MEDNITNIAKSTNKDDIGSTFNTSDRNEFSALEKTLSNINIEELNTNLAKGLEVFLEMPDDDFKAMYPYILIEFEKAMQETNNKFNLYKSMQSVGRTTEELIEDYDELLEMIDEQLVGSYSQDKIDFLKRLISIISNAISEINGTIREIISIPITFCHENAKIPQYANDTDSGMDVFALDDYTINPGETKLIPTGIKVAVPLGYELQVRPKSGRALKTKLRVANTPGTIDSGFRDEIKIIIENIEPSIKDIDFEYDEDMKPIIKSILRGTPYYIGKGEKFAQLVLCEVPKAFFYEVENVEKIGDNRNGGFGSTGLK